MIAKTTLAPGTYAMSVTPGPAQVCFDTYNGAIGHAAAFARSIRVDLWYTKNGESFARAQQYRLTGDAVVTSGPRNALKAFRSRGHGPRLVRRSDKVG